MDCMAVQTSEHEPENMEKTGVVLLEKVLGKMISNSERFLRRRGKALTRFDEHFLPKISFSKSINE